MQQAKTPSISSDAPSNNNMIYLYPFPTIVQAAYNWFSYKSSRHWNTGLVSSGISLTLWAEGALLTLVGQPSIDGIMIKIPYEVVYLLHWPASHLSFPIGWVETKSDFIVRSVETGLERWTLVVAMITVDSYPFFWLSQTWPVTLRIQE